MQLLFLTCMGLTLALPKCIKYNSEDCREFELVEIPTDGVEHHVTIANESNTPKGLKDFYGLWYMNGNPLADEVISVAGSTFNPMDKTYEIKVYDEKIWTWSPNQAGRNLYNAARQGGLIYKVKAEGDNYQVTPNFNFPQLLLNLDVTIPEFVVDFEITRTEDPDVFLRPSKFIGRQFHSYEFTRIVYGNGTRTSKYYSTYLPNVNKKEKGITLLETQLMPIVKK